MGIGGAGGGGLLPVPAEHGPGLILGQVAARHLRSACAEIGRLVLRGAHLGKTGCSLAWFNFGLVPRGINLDVWSCADQTWVQSCAAHTWMGSLQTLVYGPARFKLGFSLARRTLGWVVFKFVCVVLHGSNLGLVLRGTHLGFNAEQTRGRPGPPLGEPPLPLPRLH
jgi:hypothetical protein